MCIRDSAGTVLIMWLGEQITEKGIGNGISLIIFSGIVVGIPGALVKSFQLIKLGDMSLFIALALVILMVAAVSYTHLGDYPRKGRVGVTS